jgi:hypothetical protein
VASTVCRRGGHRLDAEAAQLLRVEAQGRDLLGVEVVGKSVAV